MSRPRYLHTYLHIYKHIYTHLSRTKISDRSLFTLSSSRCRNTLREIRVNGCVNITDSGIEVPSISYSHISTPLSKCTQALLSEGSQLQILIFHSCPLVTEQSRHTLETFLSNVGRRMRQVTWTVY